MSILNDSSEIKQFLPEGAEQKLQNQNKPQPMQVPVVCALSHSIQMTQNGLSVILYNQVPDVNWFTGAALNQIPVAIINFPISQAKDLMLMLLEMITSHEQKFGEILTPYMREQGMRESSIKQ